LTLNNSGSEAFKPDVYGENIVIERTLAANGTSQYKFRATRDGKTIATKREELSQIVDHFAITIDSPLTVLTQDAARTFLQNANDTTLYNVRPRTGSTATLTAVLPRRNITRAPTGVLRKAGRDRREFGGDSANKRGEAARQAGRKGGP
jgi:hypothetical protein